MSGITLISSEEVLRDTLADTFRKRHTVRRVWDDWKNPEAAAETACISDPLVVVVGLDVLHSDAIDLVSAIDLHRPEIGVVVLRTTTTSDETLEFLRTGAREVVTTHDGTGESVRETLEAVVNHVERRINNIAAPDERRRSRVIAVMSPKGGSGKTTVSTNLAVGLALGLPKQALLIDLDVQFGDVATALGLEPEHDLSHAVAPGPVDVTALKVFLTRHRSSLAVLPPPESLAATEDIDFDDLKRTIAALREEFRYLVIDTAAGIDEFSLVALEFATDILFVATPDVPSIRAISKQIDALDRLGITEPKRCLVINRADSRIGVSQDDIEEALGLSTDLTIPSSRVFPLSTNQGVAHIESNDNDANAKAVRAVANHFLPDDATLRSKGRLFSRGR